VRVLKGGKVGFVFQMIIVENESVTKLYARHKRRDKVVF